MASFTILTISPAHVCTKAGSAFNGLSFKILTGPTIKSTTPEGKTAWTKQSLVIWETDEEMFNDIAEGDTIEA